MAPEYQGPASLAFSKYASPQTRAAALAAASAASSSAVADNVIAIKEQIAATLNVSEHNLDAQLAIAQGREMRDEVEKHTAKLSRTLSSTVTNTHRLLELIRESMPAVDATDSPVDQLWTELEQLFDVTRDTKVALPEFLEKQRNNMELYNSSVLNEVHRDSQAELNLSHKKVNLQHNLILSHQEAFQDYKAQNVAKLKELEDLQERVSRLALEKGNFRQEIEKYMRLLEEGRSTKAEDLRKVDDLQKELDSLVESKKQLLAEIDTLRKEVKTLQGKMKAAEQEITDRFTAELKSKAELLVKETQKATALNTMISQLKGGESTARLEADKTKKDIEALNERYANQAAEHSKVFTTLNEQTKQIDGLKVEVGRFQKENADLKQRLGEISDPEKLITEVNADKVALSEQIASLTTDLNTAKDDGSKAQTEVDGLLNKVEALDKEVDHLGTENNNLLAKQAESKKVAQIVQCLRNENAQLKTAIEELKAAKSTSHAVRSTSASGNEEAVRTLEEKIIGLETALQEWTDLAKRSYKEYKDMLPTYKQADQYRKDALEKENTIKELKLELTAAKAEQTNGVGSDGGDDGAYWKNKYEGLLADVSNS